MLQSALYDLSISDFPVDPASHLRDLEVVEGESCKCRKGAVKRSQAYEAFSQAELSAARPQSVATIASECEDIVGHVELLCRPGENRWTTLILSELHAGGH